MVRNGACFFSFCRRRFFSPVYQFPQCTKMDSFADFLIYSPPPVTVLEANCRETLGTRPISRGKGDGSSADVQFSFS
ncbi:hypothetical protein BHE74_00058422 [Ensete ventricosum]|nr:hypothetical protein BHE74_00058422 [Ensete ventricosum]